MIGTAPSSHLLGHRFFTACAACLILSGAAILAACADARLGTYLFAVRSSLVLLTQLARNFGAALSACCLVLIVTTSTVRCWALWLARTPLPVVTAQQRPVDEGYPQGLDSSLDYYTPHRRVAPTVAPTAGSVASSANSMALTRVSAPPPLVYASAISVPPKQGVPHLPAPPPRCAALIILGVHSLALALTLFGPPVLLVLYLLSLQFGPAVYGSGLAAYLLFVVVALVFPRALARAGPRLSG